VNKNYSIAEQLNRAGLMLAGLSAHAERLARRGIDREFIARLESRYRQLEEYHSEQQACKARWMEQTELRRGVQAEVDALCREARKMVKVELPPESWREFGITDRF
jgi:acyl-[acyl carrier protein]--UDP-N-acetylglucosamine O-acyltransferase